jgi:hypothetical protein
MKRPIQTYALAMLLGAVCAHAGAQTSSGGVADPQAPVPATRARQAIDYRIEPAPAASPDRTWRDTNATVAGRNAMRLTMPAMNGGQAAPATPMHDHEHHAGMDMGAAGGNHEGHKEMK